MTWPNLSEEFSEVTIKFEAIANLKLEFAGPSIQQVTGFDILDISEKGWEQANFKIEDYENGVISFICKDVIILSVSKPTLVIFE